MADPKKQKYYEDNKTKRLEYQKEYYEQNKENIKRRNELRRANDPEWADKQRDYAKEYYRKNRERIKRMRLKRAAHLWQEMQKEEKNFSQKES